MINGLNSKYKIAEIVIDQNSLVLGDRYGISAKRGLHHRKMEIVKQLFPFFGRIKSFRIHHVKKVSRNEASRQVAVYR